VNVLISGFIGCSWYLWLFVVLFLLLNVAGKLINIAFQLLEDHFAPLILKRILIVTQHTIFRQHNSAEFGN
jgi:hypothetical protein